MADRIVLKVNEIKDAIIEHDGNLSSVAQALKTSRGTIANRIKRNEALQAALENARGKHFDRAVAHLHQRIFENDALLMFYLKTQGRRFGEDFREGQVHENRNIDMSQYSETQLQKIIETGRLPGE